MGALESVSGANNYLTAADYNANGQVTSLALGNGVTTLNTYDSLSLRLTSAVSARIPGNPLLQFNYAYDSGGNITQLTDGTRNEITNYQYDPLDRLTLASTSQNGLVLFERSYSYDLIGNITNVGVWPSAPANYMSGSAGGASLNATDGSRGRITAFSGGSYSPFTTGQLGPVSSDGYGGRGTIASGSLNTTDGGRASVTAFVGGSAVLPFTQGPGGTYLPNPPQGWQYTAYNYADSNHKHAVTSLSSGDTFTYDANGNMTSRVESGVTYTQTFDIENRLSSIAVNSQTTTFVYDGDGNLVKKLKPDGTTTIYVGGIYEKEIGAATKVTLYYPAAGAMRVDGTLYYLLRDHLGSASVTLDASGNVVANGEQRYYPFGESRITSAALPTDRLFTGQRFVDGTGGLYHYGARFYSVQAGAVHQRRYDCAKLY